LNQRGFINFLGLLILLLIVGISWKGWKAYRSFAAQQKMSGKYFGPPKGIDRDSRNYLKGLDSNTRKKRSEIFRSYYTDTKD